MLKINNLVVKRKNFSLNNVSLELNGGYILGVIGKNGSGKTTLFQAILDLIPIQSGSISILGNKYNDLNKEVKQDIGFILDLFYSSFFSTFTISKINSQCQMFYDNWDEVAFKNYCSKYELPDNKKFYSFSTGMKAKLWMAIALSHNAQLLILDEPTSGLDPVAREEIIEDIRDFVKDENHSVIISSHISSDLEKICDYLAFINEGKIVLYDSKDNLEESLGIINCNEVDVESIPEEGIISTKGSASNKELLVKKELVSDSFNIRRPSIEEITLHMLRRNK